MYSSMSRSSELTAWSLSRAPGVDMNPTLVTQRANQFATKTSAFSSTVLLLRREEQTMRGYLLTVGSSGESQRAATDLAHTVGARAELTDPPVGLDVDNCVGWLVYESGSSVARDPQVNTDPTETARLLANTLPAGSWVAITLRKPSKKERSRNQKWLAHRLSTAVPNHHSLSPDAVVTSIYAGGPDAASVRAYLEATRSAMSGFDVITRAKVATRLSALVPWLLAGMSSLSLAVGARFVPGSLAGVSPNALSSVFTSLVGLGVVLGLIGVLRFAGVLPSAWKRTQRMARTCLFTTPRKLHGRPTPPRAAVSHGDQQVEARDGDYPLHESSFQVGPQVVVGVVAPHAGAVSGQSETRHRAVPPPMLNRIGPMIGDSDQGEAFLSAADAFGGVALVGKAGSGKTQILRSLFAWSCLERLHPCGLPGFPGANNALVAFESKGDGVEHYTAWATALGDDLTVVDLADPGTVGIDVFDIPGTVFDKAAFFVNALRYAFGEQALGDRSFETLLGVLPAAQLVTPELAGLVPDLNPNGSPVYFVHVLLGGRGDELGRSLAAELNAESVRPEADPLLREAVLSMSPLYGPGVTPNARRNLQEAPRNKFRQLVELEDWWTPTREKTSWRKVLVDRRAVVINTGTALSGHMVEDSLNAQMSAILMFSLRHSIQRVCSGWEDQHRYVSIFADELSQLAGASDQVIAWLKDQGRSFGVRAFLATQRPEQLPERTRAAFMNFSTLISFIQESQSAAREIAEAVSGEDGEWTVADVLNLNTYTAIVRAHVDKRRQSAFTVRVRNFENDRTGFASQQGYALTSTGAGVASSMRKAGDESDLTAVVPVPGETATSTDEGPVLASPSITKEIRPSDPDDGPDPDLVNW